MHFALKSRHFETFRMKKCPCLCILTKKVAILMQKSCQNGMRMLSNDARTNLQPDAPQESFWDALGLVKAFSCDTNVRRESKWQNPLHMSGENSRSASFLSPSHCERFHDFSSVLSSPLLLPPSCPSSPHPCWVPLMQSLHTFRRPRPEAGKMIKQKLKIRPRDVEIQIRSVRFTPRGTSQKSCVEIQSFCSFWLNKLVFWCILVEKADILM